MVIDTEYSLPFDPNRSSILISQGRNGPWSHCMIRKEFAARPGEFYERDLVNAVDFALPLGIPVLASRAGVIFSQWQRSTWFYEGLDPKIGNNPPAMSTNFIVIDHQDGSYGWYSHLSTDIYVQERQLIAPGTIIATTGKNGWIGDVLHLHFHISRGIAGETLPITFRDYQGPLDHETLLKEDRIYFG